MQDRGPGWGGKGGKRSKLLAFVLLAAAVGAICLFSPLGEEAAEHVSQHAQGRGAASEQADERPASSQGDR